jgi:diaminohydroxyphosphoribosylaminopyrimidine deaminase/5-amino-6-(5-phosphoribosylamino)uracil reductase
MLKAIELSRGGFPAPNPHVGCTVVKDGVIVGEGFHDHAGGPHAEVVALAAAGAKARGADVFVTLEPCNHEGRTGPCTEALVQAGVKTVTIAVPDPNPRAAGGADRLREAGIKVEIGLHEAEARCANHAWLTSMALGRPFVVLKIATTLDGRTSLPTGESRWITSEESRARGHQLRADCGAVLVGRRTVLVDDPHLTARIPGVVNQPLRVVLDRSGQLDASHRIFDDAGPTLRVVQPDATGDLQVPLDGSNFDLHALVKALFERGITGLLVEGGPATLTSFLKAGLVDRMHQFIAPKLLGSGTEWCQDLGVTILADAPGFILQDTIRWGPDVELILVPIQGS